MSLYLLMYLPVRVLTLALSMLPVYCEIWSCGENACISPCERTSAACADPACAPPDNAPRMRSLGLLLGRVPR